MGWLPVQYSSEQGHRRFAALHNATRRSAAMQPRHDG
jgi:hypothetical protein